MDNYNGHQRTLQDRLKSRKGIEKYFSLSGGEVISSYRPVAGPDPAPDEISQHFNPDGEPLRGSEGVGPLGLSTLHICTQPEEPLRSADLQPGASRAGVLFYQGGGLVTARKPKPSRCVENVGGRRGQAQFSKASRRRLMRKVAMTRRRQLPMFVTLTYPGDYPHNDRIWKQHLRNFTARLGRKFPKAAGFWKLEPQKRGAPHYHLLIWGVSYVDLRAFVAQAWYEVVGSGDPKHLRAGTRVEWVRSWGGVMAYASKYLGKLPQPVEDPELWKAVGRYWGVFYSENIPWAEPLFVELGPGDVNQAMRYMRRFARIRSRSYSSLTVLADSDFWMGKLAPPGS